MRRRVPAVAAVIAVGLASAVAHETWMMPSAFSARIGEEVRLDVSSGMAFPRLESPIQVERISNARFRLDQENEEISKREVAESSLVLRQAFSRPGIATIWLDLKPKDIELTDDKVAEYLDEIDATKEIRSIWSQMKGTFPWRETYSKHAKTFVSVGNVTNDASWKSGVGTVMEFVPSTNPCAIAAGDEVSVELLLNSKPLAALPVGLFIEGSPEHVFRTTNDKGVAVFSAVRPGRAMLFAVRLRFDKDKKAWTSDFCTMTFEVHRSR